MDLTKDVIMLMGVPREYRDLFIGMGGMTLADIQEGQQVLEIGVEEGSRSWESS